MMLPVSGCRQKMTDIDRLVIGFTPKTSGTEIQEFSRELQNIIREQIYDLGFNIGNVEIVFTTSNKDLIDQIEKEMREAAAALDFERAAELRDMLFELKSED